MTSRTALLLLALAAAAAAAPYGATSQSCSTECPVAAAKLSFIPGKTYSYTYTGKSEVHLKGVDGGLVKSQWETQVLLTVLGPCDVAISFKDSKLDGETGLPGADKLERYPLVVATTDGRVQRVCSHPDDDTWAINMKKGVASAMQISLPSLSSSNSGLNFTETDVVGTCPTRYEVNAEGAKVMVRKEKNHRLCQERYLTPDEIHLPYLMGPLPIQESRSICRQEIDSGIISSVVCEDKKVVRPSYGVYKYVEARQESSLQLTSSDVPAPDTISHIAQGQLVPKSLRYDYETLKKEPSLVPQLEQTLRYLCEITKDGVEADAAVQMRKAVHLMRRIPEQGFKDVSAKVLSKQICPQHNKLRALYYDAIASVHEPESVEVMVTELIEGRATGSLAALYSAALYSVSRPDVKAIQALEPLFKRSETHLFSARLAAASMVNVYCRHNLLCSAEAAVRNLQQAIKQKIEQDLSSSSNEESQKDALSALKSLGNMGVMTPEAAEVVLRYMQNQNKKVSIRVAAAQAFRLAKCEHSVTQQLVQYALRPGQNTEVRIASYLAAVPCVNYEDMQTVVTKISYEENTQVRGFILSHLVNLQQSDAPEKERLRHLLTNIIIPQDFEADLRKYSRNLDLSYFSQSLGLGAELESSLIYTPGSFIPRSLGMNLTAALDGTGIPINIGEIGARLEGLEPMIAQLFGPGSYFKTSSYNKIFHDFVSFIRDKWNTIQQELEVLIRERSINYATLKNIFSKLYGPQSGPIEADVFARFLGQEITYASISEKLQDINLDSLLEGFMVFLIQTADSMNTNLDLARAVQVGVDYSFPTIQGVPLKMTLEAMAVGGMKMETNLNGLFSGEAASGSLLKMLPSFSVETHGFIGYDNYLSKSGLKMNTTASSSNGVAIKVSRQRGSELQIDVDIPDKMEIIHVQSETFLMKHKRNQPDTKILPPSMQDTKIRQKSCLTAFESVLGLKMCYNIDVPDIFQANSLPLGSPAMATLSINKTEPSIKGYKIALTTTTESQAIKYGCKVSVVGSPSPKETDVQIHIKKERESYLAEVKLQSSATRGEAKIILINRPEYKSFQTDVSFTTNTIQFLNAVKVDLRTLPAGNGKKYVMNIFSSPSHRISEESNIFTAELMESYKVPAVMELDISAKTKNSLRQYIPFTLEVGGDLKHYCPYALRKFEMETGIFGWNVTILWHKSKTNQGVDYVLGLQMVHDGMEVIDLRVGLFLQGTPGVDFKEQLFAKAKVGQAEYKMHQMIEYQQPSMAFTLQVTRPSDNLKLIEIIVQKDSQGIQSIFQIQVTKSIPPLKLAVGCRRQGQDYIVEGVVMLGSQTLQEMHGVVTFINSPSLTKLGIKMKINNVYEFVSSLEFEVGKQTFLLEIKKQEEVLIYLEWNFKTLPSQGPSVEAKIYLPSLYDSKTQVSITENIIHVSTNMLVLPRSSSKRRLKAFMDINWESRQGQMMVLWNADQDPSQMISVDAIIVPVSGSPTQATMHVMIVLLEKPYHAHLKVAAPFLLQQYRARNSISMEVETPERRKWTLEVGIQGQGENSASADLAFRSVNNNNYHLISDLQWQRLDGPFCFQTNAVIQYVSPQNKHAQFSLHAKHHSSTQRRIINIMTEASTPSMQTPLKIKFSTENHDYSYITKLQNEESSAETMFQWQLETQPEGGVKCLDIALDVKAIQDVLKTVSQMVDLRGSPLGVTSAFKNERSSYRCLYSQPSSDTHSVKIKFPSRSVEAEATYSPTKAGIKIYPNRAVSEAKYEVSGEYIKNQWGGNSRYECRASHPMLARDVTAFVEYSSSGSDHQGSFELDVLPDTADKITGSLTSVLRANNTVAIEATLSTRVLQVKPKVTVEASWAAHTAAFNFTFQKTPSSPKSFHVHTKYDVISKSYAAVTFHLAAEGRSAVDVSGVVEPRQGPYCSGFALLANAHTSLLGNFIVNSTICKPAFLEVAFTKLNGDKIYKAKLGLQSPYKAEVSLSETDKLQIWEKYISLIGLQLASPTRLKIDYEYKPEELTVIKNSVLVKASRVTEAALSWTDRVYSEVQQQARQAGAPFPPPQIRAFVHETMNDFMKIYVDLIHNDLLPELESVSRILHGPTAALIRENIYQGLLEMTHIQKQWQLNILEHIMYLKQVFTPIINEITEGVVEAAQWVQTGEEPNVVRRLVEEVQRMAVYQVVHTHVIEPIKESYPHQYQATKVVAAKVMDTLRQDLLMMQHNVWASPTLRSLIQKVIYMSQEEDTLKEVLDWWISQVTQRVFNVAPEPGTYKVGIHIPLYRPIYSLTQLVNMTLHSPPSLTQKALLSIESTCPIPVRKILETYYAWMPVNLPSSVSPFNGSALVVGDTEILTFDGTPLRVPRSPCKVLLASVPGVASVYMSHPQPSEAPEITFLVGNTKTTIKPNMEVDVNGSPVHSKQTLGDLVVEVNSHYVTLVSPMMGVLRMKEESVVMVNASSWAFNHTKGLMGLYDNERANDRLMSNGRNASSLHDLVNSWQESPSCATPAITPINPTQIPLKESVLCDILFFQMQPCQPVVSPKPFLQRCHAHPRPFEAARSYQSFCLMHGVKFPLTVF